MPGIVSVFGGADARGSAERGARPLLRRPWHSLAVLADTSAEVAIAFAGERGGVASDPETGVLVALDGEAHGSSADDLLRRYLDEGKSFEPPEGWFAAVIWDPRERELHAITDRVGGRPLYVADVGRSVVVASELKALVAAGLEPRLHLLGWAELLAYEYANADHTGLEGASLVPPASVLTISADGRRQIHERWRYRVEPAGDADEAEWVDELERLLAQAVGRRFDEETALALSGGLDSRCIGISLLNTRAHVLAATYGAVGSDDLRLGQDVAERAGFDHVALPLQPGYIEAGAAETVWHAEGHVRCLHSHHLALRMLRPEHGSTALLIGYSGDPVLRAFRGVPADVSEADLPGALHAGRAACISDELLEEIMTPGFAAQLRGLARTSLAECLAEEVGDRQGRVFQFIWRHNHRRKVLPGSELFVDDLAPRDPFADGAVIEHCRRMPLHFRQNGAIQRAYLRRYPSLADVQSPKDGFAPARTGAGLAVARSATKWGRRSRSLVDRMLGPALLPDRRGLGDYAADLRGASSPLLDVLLEQRTLERGQLREDVVRRLVRETRAGRARHTRALGMLLTFELFQRQFLEGEPPAPVRADALDDVSVGRRGSR